MRSLLLALLLSGTLLGCVSVPVGVPIEVHTEKDWAGSVEIDVLAQSTDPRGFAVELKFTEQDPNYSVIIQEIEMVTKYETGREESYTLVECFRTYVAGTFPGVDTHSIHGDGIVSHWRRMRIYTGHVEDVDWTLAGFAQLPQNEDGTVETTIPKHFNKTYQSNHETRGRVVSADRLNASTWEIQYEAGGQPELTITTP